MMKKMKGKKLLIMFKFYHVIKFKGGGDYQPKKKKKRKEKKRKERKEGGVLLKPSPLWVRLWQWYWTCGNGVICLFLDTCYYLTGSSILDALDLNQVQLLLLILFILF